MRLTAYSAHNNCQVTGFVHETERFFSNFKQDYCAYQWHQYDFSKIFLQDAVCLISAVSVEFESIQLPHHLLFDRIAAIIHLSFV